MIVIDAQVTGKGFVATTRVLVRTLARHDVLFGIKYKARDVYSLMGFLDAPPPLGGLIGICRNFRTLGHRLCFMVNGRAVKRVKGMIAVAEGVGRCERVIADKIPSCTPSVNNNHLIGYKTKHPLWSMLWYVIPDDERAREVYQNVQAQVVLAIQTTVFPDNTTLRYERCRRVVMLSESRHRDAIGRYPLKPMSQRDYLTKLLALAQKVKDKEAEAARALYAIIDLIEWSLELEPVPKRGQRRGGNGSGGGSVRGGANAMALENPCLVALELDDEEDPVEQLEGELVPPDSGAPRDNQSGVPVRDAIPYRERYRHRRSADPWDSGCYTMADYSVKVRHSERAATRASLPVVSAWENLEPYDIAVLISEITSATCAEPLDAQQRLLVLLSLFTGRSINELCTTVVRRRWSAPKKTLKRPQIILDEAVILLPVNLGFNPLTLDEEQQAVARGTVDYLFLPLPNIVMDTLRAVLGEAGVKKTNTPKSLFSPCYQENAPKRSVECFLGKVNVQQGTELTVVRVARFAENIIRQTPGGSALIASLVRGEPRLDTATPLHYCNVSLEYVWNVYMKAFSYWLRLVEEEGGEPGLLHYSDEMARSFPSFLEREVSAGIPDVPTQEYVQTLMSDLSADIREANALGGLDGVVAAHNLISLRLLVLVNIATGFRPVCSPLWTISMIDRDTGLCIISDKDTNDYYHARPVYLPREVIDELERYENHLQRLLNVLSQVDSRWVTDFAKRDGLKLERCRDALKKQKQDTLPFLFFLNPDELGSNINVGQAIAVSPSALKGRFEHYWPLQPNAFRKYIRSRFIELGCPDTVANAFMGHWHRGHEPFGLESGLHAGAYARTCLQYVTRVLREDGWIKETVDEC